MVLVRCLSDVPRRRQPQAKAFTKGISQPEAFDKVMAKAASGPSTPGLGRGKCVARARAVLCADAACAKGNRGPLSRRLPPPQKPRAGAQRRIGALEELLPCRCPAALRGYVCVCVCVCKRGRQRASGRRTGPLCTHRTRCGRPPHRATRAEQLPPTVPRKRTKSRCPSPWGGKLSLRMGSRFVPRRLPGPPTRTLRPPATGGPGKEGGVFPAPRAVGAQCAVG